MAIPDVVFARMTVGGEVPGVDEPCEVVVAVVQAGSRQGQFKVSLTGGCLCDGSDSHFHAGLEAAMHDAAEEAAAALVAICDEI